MKDSNIYRPELDALRFVAFLCVFAHHLTFKYSLLKDIALAGEFGVCLFFLLSAYLITDLLWKERDRTGHIQLKAFYVRRVLRIWPLYFALLALGVLIGRIWPVYAIEPMRVVSFLLLSGNWYTSVYSWTPNPVSPLWSISVEEQFYLLVPALASKGGKTALMAASFFVLALSYVALSWLGVHHLNEQRAVWTNSFVQFQFFGAGCILATVLQGKAPEVGNGMRFFGIIFGAGLWIFAANHSIPPPHQDWLTASQLIVKYACILAGTVIIFLAFLGTNVKFPRSLLYLGKISYGLYAFHYFAIYTVTALSRRWHNSIVIGLADLLLTIAIASLSYQYFEKPFLRLKKRFTIVPSREESLPQPEAATVRDAV